LYIISQLVGGIAAAALISGLMPGPLLIANKLGEGVSRAQGLFVEVFATSFLVLAILMLAVEKSKVTPIAPIGISMTLFAAHLWAYPITGASLNPARSFGPAVLQGFDNKHWVYWVGPFSGGLVALVFYSWLKQ
jgi:aquaporin related protein